MKKCIECENVDRTVAYLSDPPQYKCMLSGKLVRDDSECAGGDEMAIARNIKFFIAERNMTQTEVAQKAEIAEPSMCRYCTGVRIPKAPVLYRIAKVLGCTVEDLMKGYYVEV